MWTGAVLLAVSACLAGCGSSPAPTGTLPPRPPPPSAGSAAPGSGGPSALPSAQASGADVAADETLIQAADSATPATIDALSGLRFTAAGAQAAADVLDAGGSVDAVWAALWIYASAGTDPAPVTNQLANADRSDAALAAATLAAMGQRQGLAALRPVLDEDGQMRNAEPPLSLRGYAVETLAQYVSAADAPDTSESSDDVSAAAAWAAWLDAHSAQLQFDSTNGVWTAP